MKSVKLDDDLCDYNGKCWRTRQDYECTDTMNEAVAPYYDDRDSIIMTKGNTGNTWITLKEEELLLEYAPKLFSVLSDEYDLRIVSEKLVGLVNLWCNNNTVKTYIKDNIDKKYPINKNQSPTKKANLIRKHIEKIKGMAKLKPEQKDVLDAIYNDALSAASHDPGLNFSAKDKAPIKQYLVSLKLPDRTDEINSFIKKLSQ